MEKTELAIAHSNKATLKAYGYGSALIGLVVVGLVISNMIMFGYMFKQFDQVSFYINCIYNLCRYVKSQVISF